MREGRFKAQRVWNDAALGKKVKLEIFGNYILLLKENFSKKGKIFQHAIII